MCREINSEHLKAFFSQFDFGMFRHFKTGAQLSTKSRSGEKKYTVYIQSVQGMKRTRCEQELLKTVSYS